MLALGALPSNPQGDRNFFVPVRAGVVLWISESASGDVIAPRPYAAYINVGFGKAAREFFTEWKTVYIDA